MLSTNAFRQDKILIQVVVLVDCIKSKFKRDSCSSSLKYKRSEKCLLCLPCRRVSNLYRKILEHYSFILQRPDGFYLGEIEGRQGLVPGDFLEPSKDDDSVSPYFPLLIHDYGRVYLSTSHICRRTITSFIFSQQLGFNLVEFRMKLMQGLQKREYNQWKNFDFRGMNSLT